MNAHSGTTRLLAPCPRCGTGSPFFHTTRRGELCLALNGFAEDGALLQNGDMAYGTRGSGRRVYDFFRGLPGGEGYDR